MSVPVHEDPRAAGAERRKFPRVLLNLEVDYGSEDTFLFAYITDISEMGIFIKTNNPEPPGSHLNLRFSPPGAQRALEVEGEVTWVNPYRPGAAVNLNPGMGIKFVDLQPGDRQQLTELVRTIAYLGDDDDDEADAAGA